MIVKGQLTSRALSANKVEVTVVISFTGDGVAKATRIPTVWNATTGQRTNFSPSQFDIKSHVIIIELNGCVR